MSLVAGWLLLRERFGWLTFGMGVACLVMAGIYAAASSAAMRAYRADAPRRAASGALRPAVART